MPSIEIVALAVALVIMAIVAVIAVVVRLWDDEKQTIRTAPVTEMLKIFVVGFIAAFLTWYLLLGMADLLDPARFIAVFSAAVAGMPVIKAFINGITKATSTPPAP